MRLRKTIGLSLALLLVASGAALAKQTPSDRDRPAPSAKHKSSKIDAAATKAARKKQPAAKRATRSEPPRDPEPRTPAVAALPPPDRYIGPLKIVGQREVGAAAWYGGRHIGRRTASGDTLDDTHATAAHRSLPLHSLVRVTNLTNGRSVVAKITDRGPFNHSLLIDVSPSAADELDMKRAGIVQVVVEPVQPAPVQPAWVQPAAFQPAAAVGSSAH